MFYQGRSLPLIITEAGGRGGAAPPEADDFLTNGDALQLNFRVECVIWLLPF